MIRNFDYSQSMKRLILPFIFVLLLSACGDSESLSAEDRRNNFDECKITFIKQVTEASYKSNQASYDKQAEEGCAPLLKLDKTESESFKPPVPRVASSNKLTINIEHGPWTIGSETNADSKEAASLCSKNDNFTYPLGERIEIFNEKSDAIAVGTVSTFVSASYRNISTGDPDYPVEIELTCFYKGIVDVKTNGNFFRIRIAGTNWNDLTPIETLSKSNWSIDLNSDDY
jgi:hypothetical protein